MMAGTYNGLQTVQMLSTEQVVLREFGKPRLFKKYGKWHCQDEAQLPNPYLGRDTINGAFSKWVSERFCEMRGHE